MGTNYYLHTGNKIKCGCENCDGFVPEILHVGKSSCGWAFALHVIPERGLNTLDDWKKLLIGAKIKDEYGDTVSYEQMLSIITNRSHPNGLRYSKIDGHHCIGHGEGTWVHIVGEFC